MGIVPHDREAHQAGLREPLTIVAPLLAVSSDQVSFTADLVALVIEPSEQLVRRPLAQQVAAPVTLPAETPRSTRSKDIREDPVHDGLGNGWGWFAWLIHLDPLPLRDSMLRAGI
jgi:hypothetical protein